MITNIEAVRQEFREEVFRAEERARRAGAEGPLEVAGIGMYGIVFCDERNHAWKAFRREHASEQNLVFLREELDEEYEWLLDAARTSIAENVARAFAAHREEIVLERECVQGFPGGWADSTALGRLHGEIEKAMVPMGWTAPEFKENSYVYEFGTGIPHLVDISMAQRIGVNLARYVKDVLEGRRKTNNRWHDLAFFVIREIPYRTIPEDVWRPLLARLVELDPEIKKSFSLPSGLSGGRRRKLA